MQPSVTSGAILQQVPLGAPPWPTIDPFLFCVHHLDRYPAGNGRLGPAAPLTGRAIGQDFANVDGWNMYHGSQVPGFPAHPHRGFETVTFVRRGLVDHADSLGAAARYGRGDVQWLTAGAGIVHAEMFPVLDVDHPNTLELFQIWVNLPAADKMAPPHFSMFWADDVPVVDTGTGATVTVVAGSFGVPDGRVHTPPSPPPKSWGARPESDLAIWHVELAPGGTCTLPAAVGPDTVRTLYVFDPDPTPDGSVVEVEVAGTPLPAGTAAVVEASLPTSLKAPAGASGAEQSRPRHVLVLQGRPIAEPVARYGPFVMNDREGIEQAFEDYRRTQFGGWPWPADDPTHGFEPVRFARRPDGAVESPAQLP
jgi:quercetin 2,3-dioxygenase